MLYPLSYEGSASPNHTSFHPLKGIRDYDETLQGYRLIERDRGLRRCREVGADEVFVDRHSVRGVVNRLAIDGQSQNNVSSEANLVLVIADHLRCSRHEDEQLPRIGGRRRWTPEIRNESAHTPKIVRSEAKIVHLDQLP